MAAKYFSIVRALLLTLIVVYEIQARCIEVIADRHRSTENGKINCPSVCTCTEWSGGIARLVVDCSKRDLQRVPDDLPAETLSLILSRNNISTLKQHDLQNCNSLQRLDLSGNAVTTLESGCLDSLTHLREVILSDNSLTYNDLPVGLFRSVKNLKQLNIHNNNWQKSSDYNEQVFSSLTTLSDLSLDGIPDVPFGAGFSRLAGLSSLSVYGGMFVHNDTFESFSRCPITTLTFAPRTNLYWMEQSSLSHFGHLQTLNLSYNIRLGLYNASNAWWGLQYTNISKLILTRIIKEPDSKITSDFFTFLNRTRITFLSIDKNNIVTIEPMLSTNLPYLEYLDVSFNRLSNVASFFLDIWKLKCLRYLDASHQAKRYADNDDIDTQNHQNNVLNMGFENKRHWSMKDTKLTYGDWTDECHVSKLKMCMKEIFKWGSSDATNLHRNFPLPDQGPWCVPLPPLLEIVNITASLNVELYSMPTVIFFGGGHLKLVEYRLNGFSRMNGHLIVSMPTELAMDFSDNGISCVSPEFFNISHTFGSNFSEINFSGNNLASQLVMDTTGKTFNSVRTTRNLHLARNGLTHLAHRVFSQLNGLERLNLSRNYLKSIEFDLSHMHRLTYLDLSFNLLSTLDSNTMKNFTEMFQRTNSTLIIDLLGNPIQCSCDTLGFLQWISDNYLRFAYFDEYACNLHGSDYLFSNLTKVILVELSFECSKRVAVVIAGCLLGLMTVLVAFSTCCYRYRWEVRYICLKLTQQGKRYQRVVNRQRKYEYDAFVVYDSADREWVNEQLLGHLERQLNAEGKPIRLCVHERDFPPGEDILGNIWSRMECSRKTLIIVTKNSLLSNYCNYEAELARMYSVETGINRIIPVLLEPVCMQNRIPECLRWIITNLTYIEWPDSESAKCEFWNRLTEAVSCQDAGLWDYSNPVTSACRLQ